MLPAAALYLKAMNTGLPCAAKSDKSTLPEGVAVVLPVDQAARLLMSVQFAVAIFAFVAAVSLVITPLIVCDLATTPLKSEETSSWIELACEPLALTELN
ncbi:hypothetical protein D3C86_1628920 [compost metagenome]